MPGRFAKAKCSTPELMLEKAKAGDRKDLAMKQAETQEKLKNWDKAALWVPRTHEQPLLTSHPTFHLCAFH